MRQLAALATLALAACAAGPDYRTPRLPSLSGRLVEAQIAGVQPTPLPPKWWRLFEDPALDRLVERALVANTDLRQAAANLQRARAIVAEQRAARLPVNDVTAQYQRIRLGGANTFGGAFGGGGNPPTLDLYTLGSNASYEVDLFGGVSRAVEAARADLGAAQAQLDAARVSVAAETARAYAQACGGAAQAQVARETAALQRQTLNLTERLFQGGRGTARDVAQARVLVEQTEAQVPSFEAERRAALYALAFLTGDTPEVVDAAAATCGTSPMVRVPLPVGDGTALLQRRPDVRQAERRLAADTARIGVAVADLYPRISLLGGLSTGATRPGNLFTSPSVGFSLGPLISWSFPFQGAARARVRQAEATAGATLAAFDGTVLRALQEAEQALARLDGATRSEASLARAASASEEAARISGIRFRAGADSSLQLVEAERARAQARGQLAQARAARAEAQVAVFRALGGGWEDAPAVGRRPAEPPTSDAGGRPQSFKGDR